MEKTNIAYQGEIQLLGWSESDRGGRVVKFQCSGDDDEHPFKCFPSKARFMVVFVQVGDDEQPVQQERVVDALAGQLCSNVCAQVCKDKDFWTWIEGQVWGVPITSEKKATEVVKELLGIESRRELDAYGDLQHRFKVEILGPFRDWQRFALAASKQ